MTRKINVDALKSLAQEAGNAILEIYNDPNFSNVVDYKDDDSPLTLADKASHEVIMAGLSKLYPEIPIISEEGSQIDYDTRKDYGTFWLVDPLDGTKEFIKRNGEFTVNIALIEDKKPVVGFIYTPVKGEHYYGVVGEGAFKQTDDNEPVKIEVNNKEKDRVAVRSKSHAALEEEEVLTKYGAVDSISVGSSLKFCMVAEGKADIYYRHGPTMEWDTAAGQAVLESAGGKVLIGQGPAPFTYNKENLLNGSFLCLGFYSN